jgi:hypothetical protein
MYRNKKIKILEKNKAIKNIIQVISEIEDLTYEYAVDILKETIADIEKIALLEVAYTFPVSKCLIYCIPLCEHIEHNAGYCIKCGEESAKFCYKDLYKPCCPRCGNHL